MPHNTTRHVCTTLATLKACRGNAGVSHAATNQLVTLCAHAIVIMGGVAAWCSPVAEAG